MHDDHDNLLGVPVDNFDEDFSDVATTPKKKPGQTGDDEDEYPADLDAEMGDDFLFGGEDDLGY